MPICENCGFSIDREVKFCVKCGSPFNQQGLPNEGVEISEEGREASSETGASPQKCPHCGQANPQENNFCNNCGRVISPPKVTHDSEATVSNDDLKETLLELKHIEFSLSQVTNLDDSLSQQFTSSLELRKVTLLENLRKIIDSQVPEDLNSSLQYFFEQVLAISEEQGSTASESELYSIAISLGMKTPKDELSSRPQSSTTLDTPSNSASINDTPIDSEEILLATDLVSENQTMEEISPSRRKSYFDWSGLWRTLYSENAMSSFLGFGILLITISSLVLLVNYWPNEDMRLVLMVLAFVQMAAFIGVGHLVKEQIGLHFSGLALITIGSVWSLFAAGIIAYLLFDPISTEPKIPGVGLEINLSPVAWLVVSGIGTPVWGILAYKYRGYVLTHGFIALGGITIFLAVASFGQNWQIWKWAISPLSAYALALLYLRSYLDKSGGKSLRHPLVWSSFFIGLLPLIILGISYWENPNQNNGPLALCFLVTALSSLDAVRHTALRWLEHFSALLFPLAIVLAVTEYDIKAETYLPLILVSISLLYVLAGDRIRLSPPTLVEENWPILKPWFGISILLILSVTLIDSAPMWSKTTSMMVATTLTAVLAQMWKKSPFQWLPIIPLTLTMVYALNLIPDQISDLISLERLCSPNHEASVSDCLGIPLRPALMSFFAVISLIFIWFAKTRVVFSYPLTLWSLAFIFISAWWGLVYSSPGISIDFVSPAFILVAVPVICSLSIIFILTSAPWFLEMWNSAKAQVNNYLITQLFKTEFCTNCDEDLEKSSTAAPTDEYIYCTNCGNSNQLVKQNDNEGWEQAFVNSALSIAFLKNASLFLMLIVIPLWSVAILGYIVQLPQIFPAYATTVWWAFTMIYTVGLARYRKPIWLYSGTITIHIGLITLINLPTLGLDINQIGLIISVSSILYLGIIGICYKYQEWRDDYPLKAKQYIFLPLLVGAAIEGIIGLILAGWGDWGNWEGLTVTIIYIALSVAAAQISRYRFAPYVTMGLILILNIFVVGLIGGSWPTRAIGWALQGLVFWWVSKGILFVSKNGFRYDLSLWVNPLENSSTRTAIFAGAFAFITLAAKIIGIGTFNPDLIVPTSVIAILGLLYLGKAITEKNILSGYLAAAALLFSWYVQLIERDLSEIQIQLYTIPAGIYLLALGYLENRRKTLDPKLAIASNILGVIILSGSAFVQSVIASNGMELVFVLLGGFEAMILTVWGIFSKSKISFAAGILTFAINIIYQATSLLSGTNGAIIGIILGLFIIALVIIIERTKSHLVLKGEKFKDYINDWNW